MAGVIGFSSLLEPLWGLKEFLVGTYIVAEEFVVIPIYNPPTNLNFFVQIFSGLVGVVSLFSGVCVTVLGYALFRSYSIL